jgi:hypothetical protein
MRRPRLQFSLTRLFGSIALACVSSACFATAARLVAVEPQPVPPHHFFAVLLLFVSSGAAGAAVGALFRRTMECAAIACVAVVLGASAMFLIGPLFPDGFQR